MWGALYVHTSYLMNSMSTLHGPVTAFAIMGTYLELQKQSQWKRENRERVWVH